MFQYYNWEDVDINWELLDMTWEEVGIFINDIVPAIEFPPIGGGKPKIDIKKINALPEEKKRKILHIAMKIEGEDYETYKYVNDKDIVITIDHINIIVGEILNKAKISVKNIK